MEEDFGKAALDYHRLAGADIFILLGTCKPTRVAVPSVAARGIVKLSVLAVVEAQGMTAAQSAAPV